MSSDDDNNDDAGEESQRNQQVHPQVQCDTNTLFVGGLHPRIGDLHLHKLFSPYGKVVRIHIVSHNSNDFPKHQNNNNHSRTAIPTKYTTTGLQQSKGYAFVEYTNIASARLAISRLDGRQLMGRSLAVRPSRKRMSDQGSGGGGEKAGTKAVSVEDSRREYTAIQSKIEAVKRAIEQKKKAV